MHELAHSRETIRSSAVDTPRILGLRRRSRDFASILAKPRATPCPCRMWTTTYGWRRVCLPHAASSSISMLMITRSTDSGTTTLVLSGRVGSEHLPDLRRCVDEARELNLVLDLYDVRL